MKFLHGYIKCTPIHPHSYFSNFYITFFKNIFNIRTSIYISTCPTSKITLKPWFYISVKKRTTEGYDLLIDPSLLSLQFRTRHIQGVRMQTVTSNLDQTERKKCHKFQFEAGFWSMKVGNLIFYNKNSEKYLATPSESVSKPDFWFGNYHFL